MKKIISIILSIIAITSTTAFSSEIPRESSPLNATEEQICIVESLISDILDEVQSGNLGYTLAAGYANTRIRKAVIAKETNGHGYGILSPIAQNAIRVMRDKKLRPETYKQYEEYLKVSLADILVDVRNGRDLEDARKAAYMKIYQFVSTNFNYDEQFSLDTCYRDIPAIDAAMFTVARRLIIENRP